MIKLLILGPTGLLGSTLLGYFSKQSEFKCYGLIRKNSDKIKLKQSYINTKNIKLYKVNYKNKNKIKEIFKKVKPNLIINCIGVVKQIINNNEYSEIIRVNSLLPHYLMELINLQKKVRFIHFSTDCVFSGLKGNYLETDFPDADDIYGKSKILGELNYSNTLTLRTSIIGRELQSNHSLLNWFLNQNKSIKGYKNAIFSGLTALEIAKILHKFIIPKNNLKGLYHLSGNAISKLDLLKIIKCVYKKNIKIMIDRKVKINRSLNSSFLRKKTSYKLRDWKDLIHEMFEFYNN